MCKLKWICLVLVGCFLIISTMLVNAQDWVIYPDTSDGVDYWVGTWTTTALDEAEGDSLTWSVDLGASFNISFQGTGIEALYSTGPEGGIFTAQIYDANLIEVATQEANGFSEQYHYKNPMTFSGLPEGQYTLIVTNGQGAIWIEAIRVQGTLLDPVTGVPISSSDSRVPASSSASASQGAELSETYEGEGLGFSYPSGWSVDIGFSGDSWTIRNMPHESGPRPTGSISIQLSRVVLQGSNTQIVNMSPDQPEYALGFLASLITYLDFFEPLPAGERPSEEIGAPIHVTVGEYEAVYAIASVANDRFFMLLAEHGEFVALVTAVTPRGEMESWLNLILQIAESVAL